MTDHIDKSEAYRWGWDWAQLNMELHHWMLLHLGRRNGTTLSRAGETSTIRKQKHD